MSEPPELTDATHSPIPETAPEDHAPTALGPQHESVSLAEAEQAEGHDDPAPGTAVDPEPASVALIAAEPGGPVFAPPAALEPVAYPEPVAPPKIKRTPSVADALIFLMLWVMGLLVTVCVMLLGFFLHAFG